ncbi:ATP-dependent RNA helicase HrpA [Thiospirillum jenense]|uniref:ATP-dependent RNA helicase HrpA n=1 Tax=Thiospirillum jenense TaxID=1653858 RepID=A0A839HDX8_9GAMM|nr:ATP-dependent RNA helicase HrpA [Thiospirillum jenense]MBB1126694.1 ATP-dependent RNA helicase HrpA [Thiospirillum jenense]
MNTIAFPSAAEFANCLLRDRHSLRHRLKQLRQRAATDHTFATHSLPTALIDLHRAIAKSQQEVAHRQRIKPVRIDYPPELPISEQRAKIAELIIQHQVIILCGATGSGKSTQLPKICLDLGRGLFGRIGHTQPRRIAARTLAHRIAHELHSELGQLVGYKVRFHDRVRPETAIKLMTDGMLLAEIQHDRWLTEYDTLIIDEAHERSLNIDFLLGYLKQLLPKRPELKLIVTSATIDPQRFSHHFNDAPIIEVAGRTYPVITRYCPPNEEEYAGELDDAMQLAISDAVAELAREGRGDVLIFLSGEREIRETAETLRKHHPPATEILPLYARQGPAEQARIFQPHGSRRVVLATNVAETSLTVPGIHYVIDPGFARISRYSHRTKVQRLPVERISQAAANQRLGRCGRIAPGICIRLYSEENFSARAAFTEPEIQRANLAAVILQMRWLGFGAVEFFPFVEPPDARLIADGYRTLEELAALDTRGKLTTLGQQLARLPLDPRLGRMLLAAVDYHCVREVLIIAAALSVQDPRERPFDQRQAADEIHATFQHEDSDFLTLLNLWRFLDREYKSLSRRKFQTLCRQHFLSWTRVQEWRDIHTQLHEQVTSMGIKENQADGSYEEIHRALLTGLLSHIGTLDEQHQYVGARNSRFYVHPSSVLFNQAPKWVVVAERVETSRHYGRTVARVQPSWIEATAQHLLQRTYFEPHWQAATGQVAAFEKVMLYGVTLVAKRRVNYGPINPAESREIFLRCALTEGDFDTRAAFWRHNAELIAHVHDLEAKSRRRNILVDDEAIYAFYNARVPLGIYSKPLFEQWLRAAVRRQPKLLHLTLQDVMRHDAATITAAEFPDHLTVGATQLPLNYHFNPGEAHDGVTLTVPLALINQVSAERLEWLVPGLLAERIMLLLRGLPKQLRRELVPIPDSVSKIIQRLKPSERPLVQALGEVIRALFDLHIPEDAWDFSVLPPHLRIKIQLLDAAGQPLATGEDLTALKRQYATAGAQVVTVTDTRQTKLAHDGMRRWECGALPTSVELQQGAIRLRGYPALVDQGDRVAVRVLDSEANAQRAMRAGLRRLFLLGLANEIRQLRRELPAVNQLRLQYAKAPQLINNTASEFDLLDELLARSIELTFVDNLPPVRDRATFEQRLQTNQPRLMTVTREVWALVTDILSRYQQVRQQLADITQINWLSAVRDMQQQLDGLVFRGCLYQVPYPQFKHYPRYLNALMQRIDKLRHAAGRDQQLLAELTPLITQWQERMQTAQAAGRDDERLIEIRWMLEELRVSLFAQQLGTAYPISAKRIQARWVELGL